MPIGFCMPGFKLSVGAHRWVCVGWGRRSSIPCSPAYLLRVVLAAPAACKYLGLPHWPVIMGRKQPDNFMIHKSKQQTCSEIHECLLVIKDSLCCLPSD